MVKAEGNASKISQTDGQIRIPEKDLRSHSQYWGEGRCGLFDELSWAYELGFLS